MRAIIIKEEDIQFLMKELELDKFVCWKMADSREYEQVVEDVHRKFHYHVTRFFQAQGSTFPH